MRPHPWMLCAGALLSALALAHGAHVPAKWWNAAGSLAPHEAAWRARYLRPKEYANHFAIELEKRRNGGKRLAYLQDGGVSPSWYRAPRPLTPFPGRYSARLYELAYTTFLQSHRLDDAYRLAYTAVIRRPNDIIWRHRLIRVALWLGQRTEALQQWRWLAEHGDRRAFAKTLQLALDLSKPRLVVRLLAPRARSGRLDHADWKSLIFAYGALAEPGKSLAAIEADLKRFGPNRYLLEQSAYLAYQLGDVARSLRALRRIAAVYRPTPGLALQEAQLLSLQGHDRRAFAAMERVRRDAAPTNVPFWRLYAALAWNLHDDPAAFRAQKTLYLLGVSRQEDLLRLVALTGPHDPTAALAVAETGWRRFRAPTFYFESLAYAARAGQWTELGTLLRAAAARAPRDRRGYPAYWLALAKWGSARGDAALAGYAYAEAIRLEPKDAAVQARLLWMLIDSDQRRTLRALLSGQRLRPPAALRGAVRAALERLGLARQALRLTGANRHSRSPDPHALLARAWLWQDSGHPGLAWSLRRMAAAQSVRALAGSHAAGTRR